MFDDVARRWRWRTNRSANFAANFNANFNGNFAANFNGNFASNFAKRHSAWPFVNRNAPAHANARTCGKSKGEVQVFKYRGFVHARLAASGRANSASRARVD
ncbi:MAG: hypothetical protein EXS12_07015 [Phycisphaerales bacterium]|nr:hypothetical protein [Phycisphaerales bacterium]